MIIFILMNLITGVSAFTLNYRVLKPGNKNDALISFFLLYFAQIIFAELLLGILGLLYLWNLILLNLTILAFVLYISRKSTSNFSFQGLRLITGTFLKDKAIFFLIAIILAFGLVKIFINLVNPPFGWDNLNYHFTFPVEWLKHANLITPITINDDPAPTYYPINGSLFYLWLIFPLKSVFLADLGQVPFFILAFLSIYGISRKIKLSREYSLFAAAIFFIIPNFFKQLQVAYVDVMVAALFFACVNSLFLLSEKFSWQNVFVFSLSLGLLIGTKTIGLPYGGLLLIPFLYFLLKNKDKFYLVTILVLAVFLLGSFAYVRNFFETGNPIYPLDLKLFGKDIFKGVIDNVTYRAHFKIEDYKLSRALFHEGLGAQTLLFVLPGIFLTLPAVLLKRRKALNFNLAYFLILPILIYLVYRYLIPLANLRYLYALLGIGVILGIYLADILNIPKFIIKILLVICALASMSELAKRQELAASIILTFAAFLLLPFIIRNNTIRQVFKRPLTIILFSTIFLFSLIFLEKWYIKNEFHRYLIMKKYSGFWPDAVKAWDWLNQNTEGNNIAYVGRPVPFPLYGTRFKNNVFYVSVNKIDPAKLHFFPQSRYSWGIDFLSLHKSLEKEGNYRGSADYDVWLANLTKRKTDFLFIYSLHQTKETEFPFEDNWAISNPQRFAQVFSNETVHIYKVVR